MGTLIMVDDHPLSGECIQESLSCLDQAVVVFCNLPTQLDHTLEAPWVLALTAGSVGDPPAIRVVKSGGKPANASEPECDFARRHLVYGKSVHQLEDEIQVLRDRRFRRSSLLRDHFICEVPHLPCKTAHQLGPTHNFALEKVAGRTPITPGDENRCNDGRHRPHRLYHRSGAIPVDVGGAGHRLLAGRTKPDALPPRQLSKGHHRHDLAHRVVQTLGRRAHLIESSDVSSLHAFEAAEDVHHCGLAHQYEARSVSIRQPAEVETNENLGSSLQVSAIQRSRRKRRQIRRLRNKNEVTQRPVDGLNGALERSVGAVKRSILVTPLPSGGGKPLRKSQTEGDRCPGGLSPPRRVTGVQTSNCPSHPAKLSRAA